MSSPAPLNTILNQFFGTSSTTNTYFAGNDQGIDLNLNAGTPVHIVGPGIYEGGDTYRSVFKDIASGNYEYYMHITATPFAPGTQVLAGTQIGTISPLVGPASNNYWFRPPGATSNYQSEGPHLEFGVLAQPGLGFTGQNPLPSLQADYAALQSGQSNKGTWLTNNPITSFFGAAGNAIGSDVQRSTQDFTNPGQAAHDLFGTSTNPVQDAVTGLFQNLGIGKYIVLGFLGIGAIVLVYALVRGGNEK